MFLQQTEAKHSQLNEPLIIFYVIIIDSGLSRNPVQGVENGNNVVL